MKKIFNIFISVIIAICGMTNIVYADNEIKVLINNKELESIAEPVIIDGRTLIPVRSISEAMEYEVLYFEENSRQYIDLKNDSLIISMEIGNKKITKTSLSGKTEVVESDVAPQIINGITYIPVRAFAECMDAVVGWDDATRTVIIIYDTSLKYMSSNMVSTFAGTGERLQHNSENLLTTAFLSPESIDVSEDGTVYISDSGILRKIKDGKSETVEFDPSYITVNSLKCYKNDVYILTNEFQDSDGVKYYGIIKLHSDKTAEEIFFTEAVYSRIYDFDISNDGEIYAIEYNAGVDMTYLVKLNLETKQIEYIRDVDAGFRAITVDESERIYYANGVKGSIFMYNPKDDNVSIIAGVNEITKFVDGSQAKFFEPRHLEYRNGYLYVLDYNILRRITLDTSGYAVTCETVAGQVTAETNPETVNGKASEVVFAPSYLMDFVVTDDGVLLTDPKKSVVRIIN